MRSRSPLSIGTAKLMLRLGLNPYGLTYYLGLQGRGTPRHNPDGVGLEGFIALAQELGARTLEIYEPWLTDLPDAEVVDLRKRLAALGIDPGGERRSSRGRSAGQRLSGGAPARGDNDPYRPDPRPVRRSQRVRARNGASSTQRSALP